MSGKRTAAGKCLLVMLLSPVASGGDWPLSRHDLQNTAATWIETDPPSVARAWTFSVSRHVWGYQPGMSVWSSAAVGLVAGRAVVAAGSYDRNVYLLDACSGEKIWRFTTGGGVYSAPVIWRGKQHTWIFAAASDRTLYGLDAELGRRLWSHAVEKYRPTVGGARLSSPCVGKVGGQPAVFVGHWVWDKSLKNNLQAGGLTAVDAFSGKRLWRADFLDNRVSAPVFAEISGRGFVFVASEDGNLRALEADTGKLLWFHRETERIMQMVAVGSYDQRIYGLDVRTGEKVWSHPTAGPVYSSPAIVADGEPMVIFSAWDHSLHNSLHNVSGRDGTLFWSIFTGPPIWDAVTLGDSNWSSPSAAWINDRWMIYFGSYSGTFYAMPMNQAFQGGPSKPWSNRRFWVTMLLVLVLTAALSVFFTRRRNSRDPGNPR